MLFGFNCKLISMYYKIIYIYIKLLGRCNGKVAQINYYTQLNGCTTIASYRFIYIVQFSSVQLKLSHKNCIVTGGVYHLLFDIKDLSNGTHWPITFLFLLTNS